jgi:hypothetical protein
VGGWLIVGVVECYCDVGVEECVKDHEACAQSSLIGSPYGH